MTRVSRGVGQGTPAETADAARSAGPGRVAAAPSTAYNESRPSSGEAPALRAALYRYVNIAKSTPYSARNDRSRSNGRESRAPLSEERAPLRRL